MIFEECCPTCGSNNFAIIRDMTSRRKCQCGAMWPPPSREVDKLKKQNEKLLTFIKWIADGKEVYAYGNKTHDAGTVRNVAIELLKEVEK